MPKPQQDAVSVAKVKVLIILLEQAGQISNESTKPYRIINMHNRTSRFKATYKCTSKLKNVLFDDESSVCM